jgi:hypothetical protein
LKLINDYKEIGVKIYLADCNDSTINRFEAFRKEFSENFIPKSVVHLSVHDAVLSAIENMNIK